ncbi:LptF/LptG family permease [Ornithobacterium rhinotracheale]|uniref:LptF/LptG family permease n=1 Tax=Ornithobacterium rhinotracheale TaxID=28251 RepID=UPI003FA45AFA
MIKKLDWYGIRTFFGPFIFIFSVLFFIFMVQFAWQEMDMFAGKGLDIGTIFKLLFYLGLTVIQFVLPLTVLLSAIMTYGGFGERYELAAMKSSGMSLVRIMLPVFLLVCGISVGLFFFSDTAVPQSQRKARNMLLNIAKTKPAINFDPGVFINAVPGFSMKISERSGKNGERLKNVFIHRDASAYENQQTIIAKKGIFEPAEDKRFLKLALFNGYYYEDEIQNKNRLQLERQPYQQIKFDTLVHYFDISEIVEKAIEEENVTDHYRFLNTKELIKRVDTLKIQNKAYYNELADTQFQSLTYAPISENLDSVYQVQKKALPFDINKLNDADRQQVMMRADENIAADLNSYSVIKDEISGRDEFIARHVLILVRNFSNSLMCVIFFLIGAPLGAIIRKGGVGMPVVVAIVIFILFYLIYMYSENLAKNGVLNPYWAAWLPVITFTPLGIFFTYKAMTDSNLFDINAYLEPILRLKNKHFKSKNTEHARYQ